MPGGVNNPLSQQDRDAILAAIPDALAIALRSLAWFKGVAEKFADEVESFGSFPSLFMGIVNDDGNLAFYDGKLRFVDGGGETVADGLDGADYAEFLGEKVEPWSYLKSAYYTPKGYPGGIYRVGPLGAPERGAKLRHAASG